VIIYYYKGRSVSEDEIEHIASLIYAAGFTISITHITHDISVIFVVAIFCFKYRRYIVQDINGADVVMADEE
ncbi:hypothetical protein OESDEN_05286, partial [Oesophagostomum dentatum]